MKKLKNFLLGLFALMMVVMPVALVGCGTTQPEVEIADGAYYYSYLEEDEEYLILKVNRQEDKVYSCFCPAQNIDDAIILLENGMVQMNILGGITEEEVEGKNVITIEEDGGSYSMIHIMTPNEDGSAFTLEDIQYQNGVEVGRQSTEFILYNSN